MPLKRIVFISKNWRIPIVFSMLNISTTFLTTDVSSCKRHCADVHNLGCECVKSVNRFFIHESLHKLFPENSDVLYHHFDMYVNPEILKRNVTNVAKPFRCLELSQLSADRNWTWPMGAKKKCRVFMEKYNLKYCCEGWSDLFYFPKRVIPKVREAFRLSPGGLANEALMPTVINMFEYHALNCAGGCCETVSLSDIRKNGCGHKVNLTNEKEISTFLGAVSQKK